MANTLYDANSIVIATSDNTPVAMPVGASRIVGRKATGDIDDMTLAELVALGGTPDGTKFLRDDGTLVTPSGGGGTELPWHIDWLPPASTPDATPQGTWTLNVPTDIDSTRVVLNGMSNSAGAQNDEIAWDHVLGAGTWDIHMWVRKSTNTGIVTVLIDGVSAGTADTYSGSPIGDKVSVTGVTVASSGKKRISFKVATKNGSSSAYVLNLMAVELRRTA